MLYFYAVASYLFFGTKYLCFACVLVFDVDGLDFNNKQEALGASSCRRALLWTIDGYDVNTVSRAILVHVEDVNTVLAFNECVADDGLCSVLGHGIIC